MRGRILTENEHEAKFVDGTGATRILHKDRGLYIGENGRLYSKRIHGDQTHASYGDDTEFVCLGRATPAAMEEYDIGPDTRSVKERMAADHLRLLYTNQGNSMAQIGNTYGVSASYICELLQEFDIAARPPGRRARKEVGIKQRP